MIGGTAEEGSFSTASTRARGTGRGQGEDRVGQGGWEQGQGGVRDRVGAGAGWEQGQGEGWGTSWVPAGATHLRGSVEGLVEGLADWATARGWLREQSGIRTWGMRHPGMRHRAQGS